MAEGMEVDSAPAVRDKKRFEVKKVGDRVYVGFFYRRLLSMFLLSVECRGFVVMG